MTGIAFSVLELSPVKDVLAKKGVVTCMKMRWKLSSFKIIDSEYSRSIYYNRLSPNSLE
jgi:hypothetical protein